MKQLLIIICLLLTTNLYAQNGIEQSQYWFNNNFDEGVTENIAMQGETITFSENISTTVLGHGLHTFHIRFKDTNAMWSSTISSFFYKIPAEEYVATEIREVQYWFNNDFAGNVTQNTTNQQLVNFISDIDAGNLSDGLHTFHIRFKDNSGKWSSTLSSFFYKVPFEESLASEIREVQYWFNNDFAGNVTQNTANQQLVNFISDIDAGNLSDGLHTFHIRFKDNAGKWSSTLSSFFYKTEAQGIVEKNIVEYQYWLNNDFEEAVIVNAIDQQSFVMVENIDFSDIQDGLHTFHIRFKDNTGKWSAVQSSFFYKIPVSEILENKITTYRYWFDDNFDEVIVVELNEPVNPFLISLIDLRHLPSGDYDINFRFLDKNGLWSSVISEEFTAINPVFVSVDEVEDVEVNYGTEEAGAENALASETTIHDSYDGTHTVSLVWSIESYDGEMPGDYTATGTFELPEGVDQSDPEVDLKVTATVTVLSPAIVSIEDVDNVEVAYGTVETDAIAELSDQTIISDSAGEEHEVSLTWSIHDYDAEISGDYLATGTFELPEGVIQSYPETDLEVTATLTVRSPVIVSIEDVDDIQIDYGTDENEAIAKLAAETKITDSAGNEHNVTLSWTIDNYDAITPGDYTATGIFELPDGVGQSEPQTDLEVKASVTVLSPLMFMLTLEANPEEGGSVEGGGDYEEENHVSVIAKPNEGWEFDNWVDVDENVVSDTAEFDYTMPSNDVTLIAKFSEITGIDDLVKEQINIFPNPARSQVNIVAKVIIDNINITDKMGKTIYNKIIDDNESKISVHDFESGLYIIHIYTKNKVITKKLLVN